MKIAIVNGEPDATSAFEGYVRGFTSRLAERGHDVSELTLRDMNVHGCTGCFGCWVKTPGECAKRDDSAQICRAVINSDLAVFASPMRMGFTNSLLKRAMDQMIPLAHPYIEIEGGEMHHMKRYERYPQIGLLLSPGADADAEDIEITRAIWSRTARNMKSALAFTTIAPATTAKEAADELAAVA